jgi:hypothetical protein
VALELNWIVRMARRGAERVVLQAAPDAARQPGLALPDAMINDYA